jgi:hypothetical protein
MKAKMKEKKKKAKEKRSKERVLKRRVEIRAKAKEDREIAKLDMCNRERIEPVVDPLKLIDRDINIAKNDIVEATKMGSSEKVVKALCHNLEILNGMKQEYLDEQESKKALNEELEKAGCKSLQDKVEYLQQQAANLDLPKDENEAGNVGGTADVKWSPNPPKKRKPLHLRKETSVCEVVKAADREDLSDEEKENLKD